MITLFHHLLILTKTKVVKFTIPSPFFFVSVCVSFQHIQNSSEMSWNWSMLLLTSFLSRQMIIISQHMCVCNRPYSSYLASLFPPHLDERWEYMSCFVNIYCTIFLLFQLSPLVCRSWYGSWVPVYRVLGSLYNVWMVKPLAVIFFPFQTERRAGKTWV